MNAQPFPPIYWKWNGSVLVPEQRAIADRDLETGKIYKLNVENERSRASHSHYFATLNEAYINLPEDHREEYPNPESFRKKLLIRCGFTDERMLVLRSKRAALSVGAFIKPMDDCAIVTVSEYVVRIFTAKSQSLKAMGRADFEASKKAVLEYAASLIGVDLETLTRNAGRAA